MKKLLFGLSLLLSATVMANPDKKALVEDVLDASNVKLSLTAIPNQLAQLPAMLPSLQNETPKAQRAFAQSFAEELHNKFNEADAYNYVVSYFLNHGDEAKLAEVNQWLTSEKGRGITQQEIQKQTGDFSVMQGFMQSFTPESLETERRLILQRFIDAMAMTQRIGDMTQKMVPKLIRNMGAAKGESSAQIEAEIARFNHVLMPQIEAFQEQMKPQMDLQFLASMTYLYADISDADLNAYADFVSSDAGRHYLDLAMESVMNYSMEWLAEVVPGMFNDEEGRAER